MKNAPAAKIIMAKVSNIVPATRIIMIVELIIAGESFGSPEATGPT